MTVRMSRNGLGVMAIAALLASTPATAQGPGSGPGEGFGPGMMGQGGFGPGMMMGPGMMGGGMGRGMSARMCGPGAAGFAEWRIDRIERAIQPTDAQRAKLAELRTASAEAAETIRGACPTTFPTTPTGMMDVMEKRMEAMLQAIKTVRPAMDDFYNSLSDEQKTRLTAGGPDSGRFWRWRHGW